MGNDAVSFNYRICRSAMSMIAQMGARGHLDTIGVSIEDFNKTTGSTCWIGTDRNAVVRSLSTLLTSTLDAIGIQRFRQPAEYVAAGIALFVKPVNVHAACAWLERSPTAADLSRGIDDLPYCTAEQLFGLVIQLLGDPEASVARHLFERNTGLALAEIREAPQVDEETMTVVPKKGR